MILVDLKMLFCVVCIVLTLQTTDSYNTEESGDINNFEDYDEFISIYQNEQTETKRDDPKLCKTKACMSLKASILSKMDSNYKPCDDMYMYSCGGFVKKKAQAKKQHDGSVFRDLTNDQEAILKKAIEGLKDRKENDIYKKVYDWFSACSNITEKKKIGASPLLKILKSLGTWPFLDDDWNEGNWDKEKILAFLSNLGESPIFEVSLGNDARNHTGSPYSLKIYKPDLPLEAMDFYLKKTKYSDQILFAYFKLLLQLTKLLQEESKDLGEDLEDRNIDINVIEESQDNLDLMTDIIDAIKFEMNIAKAISLDKKAYYITPFTTIGELQHAYAEDVFDWKRFFTLLYQGLPEQPPFEDEEMVYIPQVKFFKEMMHLIARTEPRVIANYLMVRVLYSFGGALSPKFRGPYLEYYTSVYGMKTFSPTWSRCIRSTTKDLMYPVSALFVKEILPEPDLQKAEDLVHQLTKAYLKHMDQVKWMDKTTREAAEEKIKKMIRHVGYSRDIRNTTLLDQLYSNLKVDPVKYFDNLIRLTQMQKVEALNSRGKTPNRYSWDLSFTDENAQYTESTNKISVGSGLLMPPLFNHDYPRARTYGSIGMAVGHEITHGFDSSGARYDGIGNFKLWWTKATYKKFVEKIQCMIKQYSKFKVYNEHLNGNQTINENIADNGGLTIAYEAYCQSLKDKGPDLALPGINLTSKQLFFLSYGQLWCKYKTQSSAIHSLHTDVHSPAKARVNYVLQNMKEFSETFKCPKGSPMNPKEKCIVW